MDLLLGLIVIGFAYLSTLFLLFKSLKIIKIIDRNNIQETRKILEYFRHKRKPVDL